jgi:hypothetical protein
VLGLLQGRLLEVREREGLRHGQILEDPGNRHSCLRAGDSADALCLDGADILQGPPRYPVAAADLVVHTNLGKLPRGFHRQGLSAASLQLAGHLLARRRFDPDRAPAAYVFARSDFAGKEDLFFFF